jgi:SAM-dependent methyltransferase
MEQRSGPMRETDIRPADLFDRLLELSRQDIATFFSDPSRFTAAACAACGSDKEAPGGFVKLGFRYVPCAACGSLYVSPRPTPKAYARYYAESAANRFVASQFYREIGEERRKRIYKPRAEFVAQLGGTRGQEWSDLLVDVGSGPGIFLEEARATGAFGEVAGIEPSREAAELTRSRGFRIVQQPMEHVDPRELSPTMMTAFEVLEHVLEPVGFLSAIHRVLRPGGLAILTSLTISGFDLQVLWSESKSIYPPHHINFFSVEGMRLLARRCGFEVYDLSTPGQLDLDIVRNALRENPSLHVPRFVTYLLEHRDDASHQAFQAFLQQACLSSHMRVVLRKPGPSLT